jgi:hypothetical protein
MQNRTSRIGQTEQDRQKRTGRREQAEQDKQGQGCQDRADTITARIKQPVQEQKG